MTKLAGVPLTTIVKGGTTSQKWDDEKARFYKETEDRQAHQDKQREAVAWSVGRPDAAGGLLSLQLHGAASPKVLLVYKAKDTALEQECLCELAITGPETMMLTLICPVCLKRTQKLHDSQVVIRSEHRHFHLDTSKAGVWVSPDGVTVNIAGTITADDKMHCSALGCDWAFRIDDSKLYGSHHFAL